MTEEEIKKEEKTDNVENVNTVGNAELIEDYNFSENKSKLDITLPLPSLSFEDLNKVLNVLSESETIEKDERLKEWRETVKNSINFYIPVKNKDDEIFSLYDRRFTDKNSRFKQGIEQNGNLKSIYSPNFKNQDKELRGELAVLKVSKLLGLGEVIRVPLPHSGIWVTLKPPTEKDLIDFYHTLYREKAILGRATFGLYLTNYAVYVQNRLFNFIVNHIQNINYSDISKEDLKNYVLINDLPILAWGLACSIFANGFEYARACVKNPEECSYVYKGIINLTKLLWIDNNSLSEAQKSILFEIRPHKLTVENYRKFIAEHSRVVSSEFVVNEGIKVRLKTPTVAQYFADGLNWVNSINNKVNSLVTDNDNDQDAKKELLDSYVKASSLRKFNHYVDYIELEGDIISDRETINAILEKFSEEDEVRKKVEEEIIKYKENSIIALIGIPEFKCPNCHKSQLTPEETVNSKFTKVIPLDVLNLFFILITLKIEKIGARNA